MHTKRIRSLVATGLLVPALGLPNAQPATASSAATPTGTSCGWTGCSTTVNRSRYSVYVARDWCSNGVCPYDEKKHPRMWISPGERTPRGKDWDAFRVDAGWCYQVWWEPYDMWIVYDRRGKGARWVQVHNPETAYVVFQSRSKCYP